MSFEEPNDPRSSEISNNQIHLTELAMYEEQTPGALGVEKQRTGLKLGSGSEPALELPWWKRGIRVLQDLHESNQTHLSMLIRVFKIIRKSQVGEFDQGWS